MIRILANDGLDQQAVFDLQQEGMIVDQIHRTKEELMTLGDDFDAIIIRSATTIDADVLHAWESKRLHLIIRAGVGLDNIDLQTGEELGFMIRNTPNSSTNAVAELVIGNLLGLARFIGISNVTMREGMWNKKLYTGVEISGKTLGIIGFGRIGKAVAKKAQALGMEVIFYDAFLTEHDEFSYTPLEELYKRADFITIHTPSMKHTVIDKESLNMMKPGVFIVNASRGDLVNEADLLEALESGKVAGAALDVFANEPRPNPALCCHPAVSVTPHIGGSTKEAQGRIGCEVVKILIHYLEELTLCLH